MPIANRKSLNHKWQERITEDANPASAALDTKSTKEILRIINREDHRVAPAVRKTLPQIARAVELAVEAIRNGGRLIYLGAGTSGRLGVLDAAECLPTFGTDRVAAVMAGAPASLWRSWEDVEDDPQQSVWDLGRIRFTARDLLVGISASGRRALCSGRHAVGAPPSRQGRCSDLQPAISDGSSCGCHHLSRGRTGSNRRVHSLESGNGAKTRAEHALHGDHGAVGTGAVK